MAQRPPPPQPSHRCHSEALICSGYANRIVAKMSEQPIPIPETEILANHHPRMPYRRCRRLSIPTLPARYWMLIASIVFLLLPGSNDLLYIDHDSVGRRLLGGSCTTANEWTWIGFVSLLLVMPHVQNVGLRQWIPPLIVWTPKLSWVQLNILWYVASLLGPIVWHEHNLSTPLQWVELFGGKAAWPAFFDLIILILPTNRLSYLLDYYYYGSSKSKWNICSPGIGTKTELVNLHTKAAVTMGIWIAIHAVLLSIVYFIREPDTFWASMLPLTIYLTEGIYNFMGWVGGLFALLLWLSSKSNIRQRWFDSLFVPVHIALAIFFLICSNLHDYNTLMFAWAGLAELFVDRLMRIFSYRNTIDKCSITWNDFYPDLVTITAAIPSPWSNCYAPGRHLYLEFSSERHPLTISSIDEQNNQFSTHVKARGDWTDSLVASMQRNGEASLQRSQLIIEGMYGPNLRSVINEATSCIFVAGGVGITGLAEAIQACALRGIPYTVIWIVHTRLEMQALASIVWNDRLKKSLRVSNANASYQVFITKDICPEDSFDMNECIEDPSQQETSQHSETFDQEETPPPTTTKLTSLKVLVVVLSSMAVSFILARQMCCSQRDITSDVKYAMSCGLASGANELCRSCSWDSLQDDTMQELPCCTIPTCYLCFRGLTILSVLVLAPVIAFVILCVLRKCQQMSEKNDCLLTLQHFRRRSYQTTASSVQEIVSIETGVPNSEDNTSNVTMIVHEPEIFISTHYCRPDMPKVLQSVFSSQDDTLRTAIFVCGPQRLVDDIEQTVRRQERQTSENRYKLFVM